MQKEKKFYRTVILLYLCSCLCLVGCSDSGEVAADRSQRPLETAFAAGGADFAKWYLAGWGTLAAENVREEDLEKIGKDVCRGLGIEVTGSVGQQGAESTGLVLTGMKGRNQYEILLQKMPTETYLIINIDSVVGEGEMGGEEALLREVLAQYVAEPDISAMIKGYLPEQYTEKKGRKILTKMIEATDGIVVERTIESGYMSFTGFSERLEQSVLVGTDKVNLQCALSYDEIQGKTLVFLATPLIFAEY